MKIRANPRNKEIGGTNMTPYQALANAIVELAVKDYKTALKYHYRHPTKPEYEDEVASLERFFRSGWYEMLTDLDGE